MFIRGVNIIKNNNLVSIYSDDGRFCLAEEFVELEYPIPPQYPHLVINWLKNHSKIKIKEEGDDFYRYIVCFGEDSEDYVVYVNFQCNKFKYQNYEVKKIPKSAIKVKKDTYRKGDRVYIKTYGKILAYHLETFKPISFFSRQKKVGFKRKGRFN